jgi:hypothetical protein
MARRRPTRRPAPGLRRRAGRDGRRLDRGRSEADTPRGRDRRRAEPGVRRHPREPDGRRWATAGRRRARPGGGGSGPLGRPRTWGSGPDRSFDGRAGVHARRGDRVGSAGRAGPRRSVRAGGARPALDPGDGGRLRPPSSPVRSRPTWSAARAHGDRAGRPTDASCRAASARVVRAATVNVSRDRRPGRLSGGGRPRRRGSLRAAGVRGGGSRPAPNMEDRGRPGPPAIFRIGTTRLPGCGWWTRGWTGWGRGRAGGRGSGRRRAGGRDRR